MCVVPFLYPKVPFLIYSGVAPSKQIIEITPYTHLNTVKYWPYANLKILF